MKFTKMHGSGNDFIIINNMLEKIPQNMFSHIASTLCKRRLSIGADGIMFINNSINDADYRMHFFNADGSIGEMCGNGARCICRYGYENGLSAETQKVETLSGIVEGLRLDQINYKIKLTRPTLFEKEYPLDFKGREYDCSYIELGDPGLPHLVVNLPGFQDIEEEALFSIGEGLRNHKMLDKGANVNFFSFDNKNNITSRTFERGVENFTLSCGTGAASIGFVLIKKGLVKGGIVKVKMPGGILNIELERNHEKYEDVFISGPTNLIAEGILYEDFKKW